MKIKKNELQEILKNIISVLKDTEEKNFIFTGKEIITYNDLFSIGYKFEAEFQVSIPAAEFLQLVNEIPESEIEIIEKDEKLIIQAGKIKSEISIDKYDEEKINSLRPEKYDFSKLPENFKEAISLCQFSASNNEMLCPYSFISIKDDTAISTDNLRITKYLLDEKIKKGFQLPVKVINDLLKYEITHYDVAEKYISFKDENDMIFNLRNNDSEFPDTESLFEIEGQKIRLPVKDLQKAIKVSSVLAEEDYSKNKLILVKITQDKIICKGEKGIGWASKEIDVTYKKGTDFQFKIVPEFLEHVLKYSDKAIFNENVLLFETDNFKHVVALVQA